MAHNGELAAGESITYAPASTPSGPPNLRFIHYNDVYHVEQSSKEPVGGIPRFKTLCDYYQSDARFANQPKCLTLFSGDAFNPSLESSVTKGKHMVPALNVINTDCAILGNHDLDFGVEQFEYLASLCTFPWLCSNVLDSDLGDGVALGRCKRSVMLTSSNGIKIGIMGLIEKEWLDTINTLPPHLIFTEPDIVAKEIAAKLRSEGAEIVIALTHQREPNDAALAKALDPGTLDIILSGHDHFYAHSVVNSTHVLRSGTDFKQLSYLEAWRSGNGTGWNFHITRRDILSSIPANAKATEMVDKITAGLRPKLEKPIGYTAAPLDARFTTVRTRESNYGNFVCDLMRVHYNADCCIIASGTIRGDQVYGPGMLKVKDLLDCFPFEDPCVVIGLKGRAIVEALENAVSKYPALEGRFPQVSGITFAFEPAKPAMQRCTEVTVAGASVDLDKEYSLVTRDYMVRGKDGFHSLTLDEAGGTARSIVGDETGTLISTLLRQYFMSLKILGRWKGWSADMGRHWDGVHGELHEVHPVREPLKPGDALEEHQATADGNGVRSLAGKALRNGSSRKDDSENADDHLHNHSDSEDDESPRADLPAVPSGPDAHHEVMRRERELVLIRKVMRKWWRLAGLQGHPSLCDEHGDDFGVHWTKGICPRLEGRIRMIGGEAGIRES
ncbi:hypothetical protein LTR97_003022 [Elasticomyces elasticus]|uniref:5'-Nucleotidase C-terminal domain-containing protein n=1 Tax=Elasticomyces elasticus TaxID=574655 RepID=A0AAN8A486_9PEZI|nr:hypothetical protein LTR97_003022 [Elasticomyces elasticus]